jgi:hypothetical protein
MESRQFLEDVTGFDTHCEVYYDFHESVHLVFAIRHENKHWIHTNMRRLEVSLWRSMGLLRF